MHVPVIVCTLAFAAFASAQDATTGAIRGDVRDAAGHIPASAEISIGTQSVHASGGSFYLPRLTPGTYTVRISVPGFGTNTQQGVVEVVLGETTTLHATLQVAAVTTTVNVDTTEAANPAEQSITPEAMQGLPLDGHGWQNFAVTTPVWNGDDSATVRASVHGAPVTANNYLLDGLSDTEVFRAVPRGGALPEFRVPQAAVREFRVLPMNYGAHLGHAGGGILTTITRTGTEHMHGSVFVQGRSNLFAAVNPLAVATRYNNGNPVTTLVQPTDTRIEWGASAGGPVPRVDSLYYFGAYEGMHRSFPAVASPASPTFFSLTPTQTALLGTRGVTSTQIRNGLQYLDSLAGPVARSSKEDTGFARLDWSRGTHDRLMLAWHLLRWDSPAGLRTQTVVHRSVTSFGNDASQSDSATGAWEHFFTPALSNELRVGIALDRHQQTAQQPLPQEPHSGPNGFSPQVAIGGDFTLGKPATLGARKYPDETRTQFADLLSWSGPASLIQVGISGNFIGEDIDSLHNEEGSYNYTNSTAAGRAGAIVDFLTDNTFSSSAYPNGACPSIFAPAHFFCFNSYTQGYGHSDLSFRMVESAPSRRSTGGLLRM